jgi:DNA-binding protein HU-beta
MSKKNTEKKPAALTKRALIDKVSKSLLEGDVKLPKTQIAAVIAELFAGIKDEITSNSNNKYTQNCFGTFEVRTRKARESCSPQDPTKMIQIPESKIVGLKVSKSLKDSLNPKNT